ncbi:hypothetical protein PR048_013178, partial [Dryococelus australis]
MMRDMIARFHTPRSKRPGRRSGEETPLRLVEIHFVQRIPSSEPRPRDCHDVRLAGKTVHMNMSLESVPFRRSDARADVCRRGVLRSRIWSDLEVGCLPACLPPLARWRSGNSLETHSGGSGFDSRPGNPDFGLPWFSEITPGECWDGSLTKAKADSFPTHLWREKKAELARDMELPHGGNTKCLVCALEVSWCITCQPVGVRSRIRASGGLVGGTWLEALGWRHAPGCVCWCHTASWFI